MQDRITKKIEEHEKQLKNIQEQIGLLSTSAQRIIGAIIALKDALKEEEEVC